jgi:hypothetical protein
MVQISGKIVRGYGWATKYLKLQIPLIAREFPEIDVCHRGSINVLLDTPLRIEHPDHITRRINWKIMKEVFHFTRIEFQLSGKRTWHRARLYDRGFAQGDKGIREPPSAFWGAGSDEYASGLIGQGTDISFRGETQSKRRDSGSLASPISHTSTMSC